MAGLTRLSLLLSLGVAAGGGSIVDIGNSQGFMCNGFLLIWICV